ncbi:MAG: hypothetical protein AB7S26_10425 [Sandaracinaceae bacterium]
MPLIECPDCGRKVSDRAAVCPDCACPVAEIVAAQRADADRERIEKSRRMEDGAEVDCPRCEARGFYAEDGGHLWCVPCEHSGRLLLASAEDGFYAVAAYATERFLSGELQPGKSGVVFYVGKVRPTTHRYPAASRKEEIDPSDIPW